MCPHMALPHLTDARFYLADGKLSCQLYQRSADVFLGVPFNGRPMRSLTMMIAQECGYVICLDRGRYAPVPESGW